MAKALDGHVGSAPDKRMLDEVTRLRTRVRDLEIEVMRSARKTTVWSRPLRTPTPCSASRSRRSPEDTAPPAAGLAGQRRCDVTSDRPSADRSNEKTLHATRTDTQRRNTLRADATVGALVCVTGRR